MGGVLRMGEVSTAGQTHCALHGWEYMTVGRTLPSPLVLK